MERNRYQVTSQNESAVSALPYFSINDKFALNQEDATYTLSLEVQSPIDYVLLQVGCVVIHCNTTSHNRIYYSFSGTICKNGPPHAYRTVVLSVMHVLSV